MLDVHYKNGTSLGSYTVPFKSIGKYFAVANDSVFGTVKLLTYNNESVSVLGNEKVGINHVFSNHAVSMALADARYLQLIDAERGSDSFWNGTIANEQVNKVVALNGNGVLSKSVFNFDLMKEVSGLGRVLSEDGGTSIISSANLGSGILEQFYLSYASKRESSKDFILFSRYIDPYTSNNAIVKYYQSSPDIGTVVQTAANLNSLLLSGGDSTEHGISQSTVGGNSATDASIEWASAYGLMTATITNSESGYKGSVDLDGSYIAGFNSFNFGKGNFITGYAFIQSYGEGNFGTGIRNASGDHFSFITGVDNSTRSSQSNFTTGRGNNISQTMYSYISGSNSTLVNNTSILNLSKYSEISSSCSSIFLGKNYRSTRVNTSIVGVHGYVDGNSNATPTTILPERITRSILFGTGGTYRNNISDSLIFSTNTGENYISKVDNSISILHNTTLNHEVKFSLISLEGSNGNDPDSTSASAYSIGVANITTFGGLYNSIFSLTSSEIKGGSNSLLVGSGINTTKPDGSILISSGSSASQAVSNTVTNSILIAAGGTNITGLNDSVMILGASTTISSCENSFASIFSGAVSSLSNCFAIVKKASISSISGSFLSVEGQGINVSQIRSVSQSVILGDLQGIDGNEIEAINDSLIIGDRHKVGNFSYSALIGNQVTLNGTSYSYIFGSNDIAHYVKNSLVVGSGNTVYGDYDLIGRKLPVIESANFAEVLISGSNNELTLASAKAGAKDIQVLGSDNEIHGYVSSAHVMGKNNHLTSDSIYTDDLIIIGRDNSVASSAGNSTYPTGQIACIGTNNSITYREGIQGNPNTSIFGNYLEVTSNVGYDTTYFGSYNDGAFEQSLRAANSPFNCSSGVHTGHINFVWGMGTNTAGTAKRFTGMLLGLKGECSGTLKSLLYVNGEVSTTGADYAEYFKSFGDQFIPKKRFVTLENDEVKLANAWDDVIGITSTNPSVIGNASANLGNHRAEVGLMGQLEIEDDGTCIPNGYCQCKADGIATKYSGLSEVQKWKVMSRISNNVVLILFK
jgi:hypothetical protein